MIIMGSHTNNICITYIGMVTKFQKYITCQHKSCKKQKKKYDILFDKEVSNPNSECKKQQKVVQ